MRGGVAAELQHDAEIVATNKCLARSNKSRVRAETTKKWNRQ
jgi:hypothetical protein